MSLTFFLRWTVLVALFFTSFVRVKIKNSYEQNSDYYATTTTKIVLYNVIYSMGAYIKFVWKLHASQILFNRIGEVRGYKPRFTAPDNLARLTALSLPDLSAATEAE